MGRVLAGSAATANLWCVSTLAQAQSLGHVPRTPWGDPDLQGVFSNENDVRVPVERPDRFAGRALASITARELEELGRELNESGRRNPGAQAFAGLGPQRFDLKPTRAWLLVDPPDGKMPPLTPLGQQRSGAYAERNARTPASAADANLWYRCISIGVPRSMMPMVDGAPYRIVQSPGYVVIQYEIMHQARVIPLDGQPHIGAAIATYMGDARGHWEGDTLVVDTTNFKGEFQMTRAAGKDLRTVASMTACRLPATIRSR